MLNENVVVGVQRKSREKRAGDRNKEGRLTLHQFR
jgi:hypothetical protein